MRPDQKQGYQFQEIDQDIINNTITPNQYYDFQAIDFVVNAQIKLADVAYYGAGQSLAESLKSFKESDKYRAVISLHIGLDIKSKNHFVGLYIAKNEGNGYTVSYIDPTGLDTIPDDISKTIANILEVDEIMKTTNILQHHQDNILSNVHCGAFTAEILTHLANGSLRVLDDRLQTMTTLDDYNSFIDVGNCANNVESDNYGKKLRQKHSKLMGNDFDHNLRLTQENLDLLAKKEGSYKLTRSDSNMTNYTDLLSEMMDDQIDNLNLDADQKRTDDYELFSMKIKSPKVDEIKQELKKVKKPIREARQKELEDEDKKNKREFKTPANKNARNTREYKKKYSASTKVVELEEQLKQEKTKVVDSPISPEQEVQKLHLFRGKALNSTRLDKDGKVVKRSSDEIKDMITLKHKGITLKSDGLINNPEKEAVIKSKTREYLAEIKSKVQRGESSTALFSAGKVYDSAVKELMTRTGAKGNTVVASSKFPWVAAEYEAGNMGGAAGGDRAVPYGYDQAKKPVGRVLGNGYAISISMADYVQLRQDGDLVDVNIDMGKGVKVNQMIEEVTFNAEIPGRMVSGNLPMVLPRFDRQYNQMTEEKQTQYKKVFNLDQKKYNEYRNLFLQKGDETDVPLGAVVEHLIMHHGFLLREIAISSDRSSDLENKFMIPSNELYQSKNIDDIRLTGRGLAKRDARSDNAKIKTKYIEQRVPDPKKTKKLLLEEDKDLKQESPIKPKKLIFPPPTPKKLDHKDDREVDDLVESLSLFMPFQSEPNTSTKNEAAKKIQKAFRQHKAKSSKGVLTVNDEEADLKESDNQKTPTSSPKSDGSASPLRSKMESLDLNK